MIGILQKEWCGMRVQTKNQYIKIVIGLCIILLSLFLIYILYEFTIFCGIPILAPNNKTMDKYLLKNKNELQMAVEMISCFEENNVCFYSDDKNMYLSGIKKKQIQSEDTIQEINKLWNDGFKAIYKTQDNIQFVKWYNLDSSRGIVYSLTGHFPNIDNIKEIKMLSEMNWYYFVVEN